MGCSSRQLLLLVFAAALIAKTATANIFEMRRYNSRSSRKKDRGSSREKSSDSRSDRKKSSRKKKDKSRKKRSHSRKSSRSRKPSRSKSKKKSKKHSINTKHSKKSTWKFIIDQSGETGFDDNKIDFDILRELVIVAGIEDNLKSPDDGGFKDITFFAPWDEAFFNFAKDLGHSEDYDEEKIFQFLAATVTAYAEENGTTLTNALNDILSYHIGEPDKTEDQLRRKGNIVTKYKKEKLLVENAKKDRTKLVAIGPINPKLHERKKNIKTMNGMLHYIKYVLVPFDDLYPDESTPAAPAAAPAPSPSSGDSFEPTIEPTVEPGEGVTPTARTNRPTVLRTRPPTAAPVATNTTSP